MFIQTEATPNPATLKFIPGRVVLDGGTLEFARREDAARSPLAERLFDPARRVVDPRMGDDGEELVQARPGQCPRRPALGQLADLGRRGPVELRVAAVRVDQDVRVDRDHKRSP